MPFITANNISFHYEILGLETKKQPLILIAGYACDIDFWRPVADVFSQETQVLMFDNQGIGKTSDDGGKLTIEDMALNTKALIDALVSSNILGEGPYDIAGFAMGGLIAQQFAVEYSDNINKLVLLNSVLRFNTKAKEGCEALCKAREDGDLIQYANLIYDLIVGDGFRKANERGPFVDGFSKAIASIQSPAGQRRQVELLKVCDTSSIAPKITAPTLLIQAEPRDVFSLPEEVAALANAIATQGTKVTIHKVTSGHAAILENLSGVIEGMTAFLSAMSQDCRENAIR